MMEVRQIGVVGAGTMGNGVAQTFAVAGFPVVMRDLNQAALDRGLKTIKKSLDRMARRKKFPLTMRSRRSGAFARRRA